MQRLASLIPCFVLFMFSVRSPSARAGSLDVPVVGGKAVELGAFPDVVAVLGADGGLCTGTLLDADLVLTAGHCIEIDPIEVIIGSIDLARPAGEHRRVKWTRAYPNWADSYDVGIVMLENPVAVKARAVAQGCTTRERFAAGLPLQVVGFGLTTKTGDGDNTRLYRAIVPVVDPTCERDPACQPSVAPGGELVAGGHGTDACFGDSGGPLFIDTAQGLALIGVVSRSSATVGDACDVGGIYVRADKVVAWIQNVSGRKLKRVSCDGPADDAGAAEPSGCNAAAVQSGFALYYAALVLLGLRQLGRRRRLPQGGSSAQGGRSVGLGPQIARK